MANLEDRFNGRASAGHIAVEDRELFNLAQAAYGAYIYPVGTALLEIVTPPLDDIVNYFPHPDNKIVGRHNANEGLSVGYFDNFHYEQKGITWSGTGLSLYRSSPDLYAGLTVALVTRDSHYDSSPYGITQRNYHKFGQTLDAQVAAKVSTADLMVIIRANSKLLNEIGLMREMSSLIIPRGGSSFVRSKNATPEIEKAIISKGPQVSDQLAFIADVTTLLSKAHSFFLGWRRGAR